MPSKCGRRSTTSNPVVAAAVVSGPSIGRSREEWDAAGFTAAEISRPLQRGGEVERFNDLASRDDELTSGEADELYRLRIRRAMSRLRQLARARARGDEESIRAALEDLDGRLGELRPFEDARRLGGLASGYPFDLEQRQAAIDQLLELARRRPPGLVAGSEIPPDQPAGEVQLVPPIAFRTTPEDVPVYILAPRSLPSEALTRNAEAVARQGANLHVVHDPAEIPHQDAMPALVLNWGRSDSLPADLVALNRPEAVRIASDQVESLRRLGELAPRTVLRPDDIPLLGSERVVAKRRQGARGGGKAVIAADAPPSELVHHDLFQQLVSDRDEFRVGVLNGNLISAYAKRAPAGTDPENLRPEWEHEPVQTLPASVVAVAREGAQRIGLDYAGVDVIVDRRTGRAYCLEANAAPGMSEQTLRSLYAHLQRTLRRRLARAS